eukprot:489123-Alexandrium_andersonii.AAC.1
MLSGSRALSSGAMACATLAHPARAVFRLGCNIKLAIEKAHAHVRSNVFPTAIPAATATGGRAAD